MLKAELKQLHQRKKELLLESDINRQIVRVEVAQLQLKAAEWRRGLFAARNVFNWVAPMAGIGFALWGMRSKTRPHADAQHNRRGRGKTAWNLFAPIGIAALRRAYGFWCDARKRGTTSSRQQ